jgi:hypothetical protein
LFVLKIKLTLYLLVLVLVLRRRRGLSSSNLHDVKVYLAEKVNDVV